jgi:UDP-N-acetyl-D-mannosaminuronate dehydrogenase
MPLNTVNRLIELMGGSINQKKVLICGVSYKQDVGDTRYSPSELLVRSLSEHGAVVTCHDPFIKYWDEMEINLVENVPQSHQFDAVIFAVPHQYYRDFDLLSWAHPGIVILDANNIFSLELRQQGRTNGLKIESIGRGNGL